MKNSEEIFFTKLLPVEDVIEENDIVRHKDLHESVKIFAKVSKFTPIEYYQSGEWQKYKLLLCSNTIKEGDVYFNSKQNSYLQEKGELKNGAILTKCFKVIGEISKDASWLIENSELESHQFKIEVEPCLPQYGPWLQNYKDGFRPIVKVLGSCGKFH